jgi:hypothetical protein
MTFAGRGDYSPFSAALSSRRELLDQVAHEPAPRACKENPGTFAGAEIQRTIFSGPRLSRRCQIAEMRLWGSLSRLVLPVGGQ